MSKDVSRCFPSSIHTPHIFLCGEKGCGKTTIIQSVIAHFEEHIKVYGFSTHFEIKSQNEKTLFISPLVEPKHSKPVMEYSHGTITIFKETFDTYGVKILEDTSKAELIIMDELGRFEQDCNIFQNSVFKCLDNAIPILGVLQIQESESWLDSIKDHQNVTVLNVTEENRKEIEKTIINIFT